MNANDPRHPWSRLVAAARTVPDPREVSAPYGFSTRVAALAFGSARARGLSLDRLALRALGVASLLAIASVVLNYSALTSHPKTSADEQVQADDPMAVLLDT